MTWLIGNVVRLLLVLFIVGFTFRLELLYAILCLMALLALGSPKRIPVSFTRRS